ncbi:hypothetical protein [Stenotrophomonas maltophilia]|uniref:hypothetical protein n=1 Tax=Stenotrophomonas maltophilia TaxID=40324 RepID=UPI0039C0DF4D
MHLRESETATGSSPERSQHSYTVVLSSGDEMFLVPGATPEEAARNAVASWANRYGEIVEAISVCRAGEGIQA